MLKQKNSSSKYIKKYIKELKKILFYSGQSEQLYLKRLQRQMKEYADDSSIVSYENLVRQFGSPQEVAAFYYKNLDEDKLLHRLRFKKYLLRCILFILFCCFFYFLYNQALIQKAIKYGETVEVQRIILPPIYHHITNE